MGQLETENSKLETAAPAAKQLVLVSGMAGAGKSIALKSFEDMGFFCIDNLPLSLGQALYERLLAGDEELHRLALAVDGRAAAFFELWAQFVAPFRALEDRQVTLLFLTADDEVLVRRFSQMRRVHPLAGEDGVAAAIARERQQAQPVAEAAELVLDTSSLTPNELRATLLSRFGSQEQLGQLPVRLTSFGFKRGIPAEADLVFDVRFLPNPYFVPELKARTGKEAEVAAYVFGAPASEQFFGHLQPLIDYLLPLYQQAGKMMLTIAIGCTGGKHRSVAVTERLGQWLQKSSVQVRVSHRDLGME